MTVHDLVELQRAPSARTHWIFVEAVAQQPPQSSDPPSVAVQLEAADAAYAAREYRIARDAYRQVASLCPELAVSHQRLGAIELANDRAAAAVPHLETACRLLPDSREARLALSEAHSRMGDFVAASAVLHDALKAIGDTAGEGAAEVRASLGLMLFQSGERQRGLTLLMELLQHDAEDQEALSAYGEVCLELGQMDEALQHFLRLITVRHDDKRIRRLLARALGGGGGPARLARLVPPSHAAASSIAYVAAIVKDHGDIDCSVQLHETALSLAPESAACTLSYMRTLELQLDYAGAIRALCTFCAADPRRGVRSLTCGAFATALLPLESVVASAYRDEHGGGHAIDELQSSVPLPNVPAGAGCDVDGSASCSAQQLPPDELELLAVFYVAIKALFCMGALTALPPLIEVRCKDSNPGCL